MQSRISDAVLPFSLTRPLSAVALVCALLGPLACASPPPRAAMVVGNGAYTRTTPLPSPPNDAHAIAQRLQELGWEVTTAIDVDAAAFEAAVSRFAAESEASEQRIFFYAGHSMQIDGENYFVPIGFDPRRDGLEKDAPAVSATLEKLRGGTGQVAVVLDASYDNPVAFDFARIQRERNPGQRTEAAPGLAEVILEPGTYIAYSTAPGHITYLGSQRNSAFTRALLEQLGEQDWEIGTVLVLVRDQVMEQTGGTQVPWDRSALTAPFKVGAPEGDE